MAQIKIDPEGGNPYGAAYEGTNTKQANEEPENIYLPGPDSNTEGALSSNGEDLGVE